MHLLPLTTIATLLALLVYFFTFSVVGKARTTYGVSAPAITGNVEFEKRYRVQMNTVEQIVILLPVMWLCAIWVRDLYAAIGGVIWSIGRIIYAIGYYNAPQKRGIGFALTIAPSIVMFLAVIAGVIRFYTM